MISCKSRNRCQPLFTVHLWTRCQFVSERESVCVRTVCLSQYRGFLTQPDNVLLWKIQVEKQRARVGRNWKEEPERTNQTHVRTHTHKSKCSDWCRCPHENSSVRAVQANKLCSTAQTLICEICHGHFRKKLDKYRRPRKALAHSLRNQERNYSDRESVSLDRYE